MQSTDRVLMIRPAAFASNPQTAASNAFQHADLDGGPAQQAALAEFDAYVEVLRAAGVTVLTVDDTIEPHTPDSIFPNNWVSFHPDGTVVRYPMEALNRRQERRDEILDTVAAHYPIRRVLDLTPFERDGLYLEGTGSMVLDHEHRLAYACLSSRTHPTVLDAFCAEMGYRPVAFRAVDAAGLPIYHTNVMMCVGRTLAVICLSALHDEAERRTVVKALEGTGKQILDLSMQQIGEFAGNMLELKGTGGRKLMAMSRRAWRSLTAAQRDLLTAHAEPVLAPVDTIERLGGGSARCMLAEVFLPLRAA